MTRKNSYRIRLGVLIAVLVFYPIVAFTGPRQGRAEFYPFFVWNLFSRSTDKAGDAVVFVHEINSELLPNPTLFFDLGDHFSAAKRKDIRLGKMLDNLVAAEVTGNRELSDKLSQVVEQTYLAEARQAKYSVAVIYYHPIVRYKTGRIEHIAIVKQGEKVSDPGA